MPSINFKMEQQEHNNWCWAAVAVSMDHFFDQKSSWCQCRLATRMVRFRKLKTKQCGTCKKPKAVPEACNKPWFLDWALKQVHRLTGKIKNGALTFEQIQRTINAGRPVCLRLQWGKGPDAHFVIISGFETAASGNQWVDVEDPASGSSTWLYDEFRTNYQYSKGHWTDTFPV